jgi:hypothetical protein
MNDVALRSALRNYLERSMEQDRKLNEALSDWADLVGPSNVMFDYASAHMVQLTAREKLIKEFLQALTAEPSEQNNRAAFPAASVAASSPSVQLDDPFAQELVRIYNEEPERWTRLYRPVSFGAANIDEIWRNGGDPKFTKKEGGIYHLLEAQGRFYVVPEPGLRLQEGYWRSEGIGHLFACPHLEEGESGSLIWLVSPARVEEAGDRWCVTEKGEIRERG